MKKYLILSLFLVLPTVGTLPTNSSAAAPIARYQAAPSQTYFALANELASLFQQIEKLPNAQASTLLRQKAPTLQARIKQVKPAYQKYLKSLSVSELKSENERVATSRWGNYFSKIEAAGLDFTPKLKALLKPGSPSSLIILDLMGLFEGI